MAARVTRSASRAALNNEALATGPLGALSHDELGVIVDGLADPLQPVVAVALSSTCLGLRTPLQEALKVLKERHARAVALCRKVILSCAKLRTAKNLTWFGGPCRKSLTANDMATLGMLLSKWLPKLQGLYIRENGLIGDAGMQALCNNLDRGTATSLRELDLTGAEFGPVGAEALAAALGRGTMPKLEVMALSLNAFGSRGASALAIPVRKSLTLKELYLSKCKLGDEGVASLVANLGKDDFKALEIIHLDFNCLTGQSRDMLICAIREGAMPAAEDVHLYEYDADDEENEAVEQALDARRANE